MDLLETLHSGKSKQGVQIHGLPSEPGLFSSAVLGRSKPRQTDTSYLHAFFGTPADGSGSLLRVC